MAQSKQLNQGMNLTGSSPEVCSGASISFQDAMSCLASGVAVVACTEAEHPRGLLVSSLTPLSADPPSVLFCVRKAASCYEALSKADRCSIAILSEAQQAEAERFSRIDRFNERFCSPSWTRAIGEPPEFTAALVSIVGRIDKTIDAGTHGIMIVNIERMSQRLSDPLIYFNRRYQRLSLNG